MSCFSIWNVSGYVQLSWFSDFRENCISQKLPPESLKILLKNYVKAINFLLKPIKQKTQ